MCRENNFSSSDKTIYNHQKIEKINISTCKSSSYVNPSISYWVINSTIFRLFTCSIIIGKKRPTTSKETLGDIELTIKIETSLFLTRRC